MTKDEALKMALETLENNRQAHQYCEDTWYSCPKHEDGCANESEGNECNCGADKANAETDKAISAIKQALAGPEQGPVSLMIYRGELCYKSQADDQSFGMWCPVTQNLPFPEGTKFYTTPPQPKPLTEMQINDRARAEGAHNADFWLGVRFAEVAHGIKGD